MLQLGHTLPMAAVSCEAHDTQRVAFWSLSAPHLGQGLYFLPHLGQKFLSEVKRWLQSAQ